MSIFERVPPIYMYVLSKYETSITMFRLNIVILMKNIKLHWRFTKCISLSTFSCSWYYNSNMDIGYTLGCPPAAGVSVVANSAFPNLTSPANVDNAFGFYRCDIRYASNCRKTIYGSQFSLTNMNAFWQSNITTFYTVCI